LRAERLAGEASASWSVATGLSLRPNLAPSAGQKETELQSARGFGHSCGKHQEQARKREQDHAAQLKTQEAEWVSKVAGMADSSPFHHREGRLARFAKVKIERQIQSARTPGRNA